MNRVIEKTFAVLAIVLALVVWRHYRNQESGAGESPAVMVPIEQPPIVSPGSEPKRTAEAGGELCGSKSFCAVIYVTPWCPACQQSAPRYRAYLANAERSAENGIQVVVGEGRTPEQNNETVSSYGSGALADNNRSIGRMLGVPYYPSHFVLDSKRAVFLRDPEASAWIDERFR